MPFKCASFFNLKRRKQKHSSTPEPKCVSYSDSISSPTPCDDSEAGGATQALAVRQSAVDAGPEVTSDEISPSEELSETGSIGRNLWKEAFENLDPNVQRELRKRGMDPESGEPMSLQIQASQEEAERQRDRSLAREWKCHIGEREVQIRQLTVDISWWAKKIGGVAIQFAPSPGGGVWAVIASILKGVETFDQEKSALVSVVDKVATAIYRSQVYLEIYTVERTEREEVVQKLQDAVVNLYSCILELLVKSSDLSSNTAVQFWRAMVELNKPSEFLSELEKKERYVQQAAESCEVTARARQDNKLRENLEEVQVVLEHFEQNMQLVDGKQRIELLEWISHIDYGSHLKDIEYRRSPDTGGWLIEHEKLQDWINSPSSQILWLQGFPGTGKTYLSSALVKHIQNKMEAQLDGLAFFFCKHDDPDRRQAVLVLRSLVRQLAAPKSNESAVRKSLQEARERAANEGSHLSLSDCRDQLMGSFNLYSTTFIVIDALDEVLSDELDMLIRELQCALSQTPDRRVKLFVASRPEQKIDIVYSSNPTVIINAGDNRVDIEKFVTAKLDNYRDTHSDPNAAVNIRRDKIINCILGKCDNMFLWVRLQMDQILQCISLDAIDEDLENLPSGLDETYDRMYKKLEQRRPLDRELGKRALHWVMSAPRPLTTKELLFAVRINIKNENIDLKHEIQQDSLLVICENFLIVDSNDQWRYFHLSVHEYFDEKPEFYYQAITHCAQVCFLSLVRTFGSSDSISVSSSPKTNISPRQVHVPRGHFDTKPELNHQSTTHNAQDCISSPEKALGSSDAWSVWASSTEKTEAENAQRPFHRTHPFSRYIQIFWPFYASRITRGDREFKLILRFLGPPSKSSQAFAQCVSYAPSQVWITDGTLTSGGTFSRYECQPLTTPVFTAIFSGLSEVVSQWCEDDFSSLLHRNRGNRDALEAAVEAGHILICNTLISKGFSIDGNGEESYYDRLLNTAVIQNNLAMVRFFVETAEADGSLPHRRQQHSMALDAATLSEDTPMELVRYLTERAHADVNVSPKGSWYGGALANVARWGNLESMRYLVEEANADVNLPLLHGKYGSALAAATFSSRRLKLGPIKYLVEAKADVNAQLQGGQYGSALAAATQIGDLGSVKYLVEVGKADVNLQLQYGKYGSALAAASSSAFGDRDVLKYLVEEASADVNLVLQYGEYGSALAAAAAASWNLKTVEYLVEIGKADVDLPLTNGKYGSAIAAAKKSGHGATIRYLQRMSKVEGEEADNHLERPNIEDGSDLAAEAAASWKLQTTLTLPKKKERQAIAATKISGVSKNKQLLSKVKKSHLSTDTPGAKNRMRSTVLPSIEQSAIICGLRPDSPTLTRQLSAA